MGQATVLLLRCPRCGQRLGGTQHDVVFWCGACGVPQEVVGSAFVERPGRLARAVLPGPAAILYLPVWAFRVGCALAWDDPQKEAQARLLPAIEWVYVTGFAIGNAAYFGDPGMIFTEKRVALETRDARERGGSAAGCTRGLEEAKAYVEPHLLQIVDRRVDITGLDLRCRISDAILWGVPFQDEGETVRDRILDLKIPAAAITELAEIRASQKAP